jgi:riboflavin kinase / FMN adenylyltransferase
VDGSDQRTVVTIGFFDGVHRGHRSIVRRALRATRARRTAREVVRSVVLTFDRHPMAVVRPESTPALITPHEHRYRLLAGLGPDLVVALPFDRELAGLEPDVFVQRILVERLGAAEVVVGENFRFGRRAAGDVATLTRLGAERGFTAQTVPLLALGGTTISSTAIREHAAAGDVAWASRALGRPFALIGEVGAGDRRGRELGVPTANLVLGGDELIPAHGVYAGSVVVDGKRVPAATSIGVRPTFGEGAVTVEVHLIDWEGDLYGERIEVQLRHRLRDEQHYDDVDALVAQMHRDIDRTRRLIRS